MLSRRRLERRPKSRSLFDRGILVRAFWDSFRKLDPRWQARNPVMFVVEVGAAATTVFFLRDVLRHAGSPGFDFAIAAWLWFTVAFANFAEAVAEGRGKAQAEALRRTKSDTFARLLRADGTEERVASTSLHKGDRFVVEAGEIVPADGDVLEGAATIDESAITGESAPVIRESGGDRSAVTGGTRVLSDRIVVRVSANPGESFLDRMIRLVEGAQRQKTPNEIALSILLSGLTIIFLIAVATLAPYSIYAGKHQSVTVLIALLVCLIPTTIGGLLSAIGIAGMDRVMQRNVLAMSGRAVEAAGDVDTLLLDKTGTITLGNRQAVEIVTAAGIDAKDAARIAYLSSLADETPEGRSIVALAQQAGARDGEAPGGAVFVPFSAYTRMSGLDLADGSKIRKGAPEAVLAWIRESGGDPSMELAPVIERIARSGGTPLLLARQRARSWSDLPEGYSQAEHDGAVRPTARDGNTHRHDHGRQSAHGGHDRKGGRRGRLPRRGDSRNEDGTDQARAELGAAGRDDRRRHERCAGARAVRRGRGDELRNAGRQGSREYGGSRFRSDQTDRDRRNRQAAAYDARRFDHILDRQRRGKVFCDPAGDVCDRLSSDGYAERDAPVHTAERDSVGGNL